MPPGCIDGSRCSFVSARISRADPLLVGLAISPASSQSRARRMVWGRVTPIRALQWDGPAGTIASLRIPGCSGECGLLRFQIGAGDAELPIDRD